MAQSFQVFLLSLAILLLGPSICSSSSSSQGALDNGSKIRSATFLTPEFVLGPGSVENGYYYNIDFPRGHVSVKSFEAELVDEFGNYIPLGEAYAHHWTVWRYYQRTHTSAAYNRESSDHILVGNNGICQRGVYEQYFALVAETKLTASYVPDPYGIEVGNPDDIPEGFEEQWMINIHVIDTRGVENRLGCVECHCDLYNVTVDEFGNPLPPNYTGGLLCCYGQTQCKLRQGFEAARRKMYLQYTVKWVEWDSSFIPVKIYIFDVTDDGQRLNYSSSTGIDTIAPKSGCRVEYEVKPCNARGEANSGCIDVKRTTVSLPAGGYLVYGVAHQHAAATGSTLYRQEGQAICTSRPIYDEEKSGYILGMSTCYPKPGSVWIEANEILILESNYSNTHKHTGVMGLFFIWVADRTPSPTTSLDTHLIHIRGDVVYYSWAITVVALLGLAIVVTLIKFCQCKKGTPNDYQPFLP